MTGKNLGATAGVVATRTNPADIRVGRVPFDVVVQVLERRLVQEKGPEDNTPLLQKPPDDELPFGAQEPALGESGRVALG